MNNLNPQIQQPEVQTVNTRNTRTNPDLPQSPYNGVSFNKINQKWSAKVLLNKDNFGFRKLKHIGYFTDDREAAVARNKYIEDNNLTCRKSNLEG